MKIAFKRMCGKSFLKENCIHKIELNCAVSDISEIPEKDIISDICFPNGKQYFITPMKYTIYIDYPLGCTVATEAHFAKCVGELLWHAAKAYTEIYDDPEKYKIWGHHITDLYFEGINIYESGSVELIIGS